MNLYIRFVCLTIKALELIKPSETGASNEMFQNQIRYNINLLLHADDCKTNASRPTPHTYTLSRGKCITNVLHQSRTELFFILRQN
jgi:hypothetical protein